MVCFDRAASARAFVVGAAIAIAASVAPTAASAGFLDELFGGGSAAPTQPFGYEPPQTSSPQIQDAPVKRRPRAKQVVIHDETPVRQKTTDLWHDKTLRPGDAIMMKDGMHVFKGYSASLHTPREFVPVTNTRLVSSKERSALLALDTTHNDPLKHGHAPDTIASGRSAAVAVPVSKGIRITDARGASIRYVGP